MFAIPRGRVIPGRRRRSLGVATCLVIDGLSIASSLDGSLEGSWASSERRAGNRTKAVHGRCGGSIDACGLKLSSGPGKASKFGCSLVSELRPAARSRRLLSKADGLSNEISEAEPLQSRTRYFTAPDCGKCCEVLVGLVTGHPLLDVTSTNSDIVYLN